MTDANRQPASPAARRSKTSMTAPHGNDLLVLFALWLLVFSASSQLMIVAPMLPQISRELDVPGEMQGVLVSAYALMVGIFALIVGPISDKYGRRRVLLAGTALMAIALTLHAAATTFTVFLLVRLLAGLAGGVLTGSAVSYVGDYFPYNRRGWANGWIMSSTALGQIAGVPLGTVVADSLGFRMPFLMFAVTMAVTFLLVWQFVPQPDVERAQEKLTVSDALRKYWRLLHRGEVVAGAGAYMLMYFSFAFLVVFLPTWLASEFAATQRQIASVFFVGGIANVITGPIAGRLSDRIGRKGLVIYASLGFALVSALLTFVTTAFWIVYPLFFVMMILVAARMSPFQALVSSLASGAQRGSLMSLAVSIGNLGSAVGGSLAGLAYARFGYRSNTMLGAVAVVLMAALVWRFLPEPRGDAHEDKRHAAQIDAQDGEAGDVAGAAGAEKREDRRSLETVKSAS